MFSNEAFLKTYKPPPLFSCKISKIFRTVIQKKSRGQLLLYFPFYFKCFISNVLNLNIALFDKKLQGHLSALVWKNKNLVIWNK